VAYSAIHPPTLPPHSYAKALRQAHDGQPGAARVLYQQLQRNDLPAIRRAALYAELPNYPSPQALKLARQDLEQGDPWSAAPPSPDPPAVAGRPTQPGVGAVA
jgi:hypothetical protein